MSIGRDGGRRISKPRIFYIVSLIILGVLLVRILVWPMTGGEQGYSEVQRESLLHTEHGWVLQSDVINHEGKDENYTINVSVNDEPSILTVLVRDKGMFTYIKHIYSNMFSGKQGQVNIIVYKEGEDTPFEQGTWYLKKPAFDSQRMLNSSY